MPISKILPASIQTPNPRNLVHNGGFMVYQRGGTITMGNATVTPHIDRFTAYKNHDGANTVQQSTDGPEGFKNSLLVTTTTADDSLTATQRVAILHRIEGQDVAHLEFGTSSAKTITLGFWVKSSVTGTHGGAFSNGSWNRNYPFTYTISSSDTWEYKTITAAGDTTGTWATDTTTGLQVSWGLGVGSTFSGSAGSWAAGDINSATGATTSVVGTLNATWQLTGVSLTEGSKALSFPHESYQETLAKCQRYFYQIDHASDRRFGIDGLYSSGTGAELNVMFTHPTSMRAAPTLTVASAFSGTTTFDNDTQFLYMKTSNHSSGRVGVELGSGTTTVASEL